MAFNIEKATNHAVDINMRMDGVREEMDELDSQIEALGDMRESYAASALDDDLKSVLAAAAAVGEQALSEEMDERLSRAEAASKEVRNLIDQEQRSLSDTSSLRKALQEKKSHAESIGLDGEKLYGKSVEEAREAELSIIGLDAYLSEMDDQLDDLIERFGPGGRERERVRKRLDLQKNVVEGIQSTEKHVLRGAESDLQEAQISSVVGEIGTSQYYEDIIAEAHKDARAISSMQAGTLKDVHANVPVYEQAEQTMDSIDAIGNVAVAAVSAVAIAKDKLTRKRRG